MSPTPVDEHTQEFEQLAGLSALRALEGDELARFQRHAARCERCQLMVRLDREALARVSLAAPEMDPSPDFKARLLRHAAEELHHSRTPDGLAAAQTQSEPAGAPASPTRLVEPPLVTSQPAPPRPAPAPPLPAASSPPISRQAAPGKMLPFWRRSPFLSALAAVLVLGLVTAGGLAYENQTVATYALSGAAPGSGSTPGSARVIIRRSGAAELEMRSEPDPDPGWVYEAWIIPPGQQPVAAGTSTSGEANVPLPGNVRGSTVAVTRERGRVDAPTSDPLMATVVEG